MPLEYSDTFTHVYCNDCEKKSHAKFHFIYHKCGHCKGYNTKILGTVAGLPEGAIIAPDIVIPTASIGPGALTRLVSSTSIISSTSASSSEGLPTSGYWCHQCHVRLSKF